MNRIRQLVLAISCILLGTPGAGFGQAEPKPLSTSLGMVVFPAKGQATQQQSRDEGECYAWSKGQTGVDPLAPPAATPPAAQSTTSQPA